MERRSICPWCLADLSYTIPGSEELCSKVMGIEIRGVYDGVLYWQCPKCDGRWHRFREGTDLYRKADRYINV